jgi:hypothetical protein
MLWNTPVQRLKGGKPTTGLPSSRLVTCHRELSITFKPQCKDDMTAVVMSAVKSKNTMILKIIG